jgi:hypothetical protein
MTAPPSDEEALSDRSWFKNNPLRRYRRRRVGDTAWIIRRRGGDVLLRTLAAELPRGLPDTDKGLRGAWIAGAWRDLNPRERDELAKQIRREEKLLHG